MILPDQRAFAYGPALLLLLLASTGTSAAAQPATLHVSGQAMVSAEPDRSRLILAVETEANTAQEASQENAQRMRQVLDAVRAIGVSGMEIETTGYQVTPIYAILQPGDRSTVSSYRVRNQIVVRIPGVESVGRITDAALAQGANRVVDLGFELSDPTPHRREALRRAVAEARAEAEVMAQALGMRLGPLQRMEGGADPALQPFIGVRSDLMMRAMAPAETPVEPSTLQFTARVSLIFAVYPPDALDPLDD